MEIKDALELAKENYTDYCKYVSSGRSFPNLLDGLKSVAKRSIYGMYKDAPRTKVKVAKLASYALPYHPHPTSISGAITQLGDAANKIKLIDTQGNWGDSSKGIKPAADRYIEGKLSDLAIKLCCDSVEYSEFIKGEIDEDEPKALPCYLPICFINGVEGIPSGLPKINIPTLNIDEMIKYYLAKLKAKDINFKPKKLPSINVDCEILSTKQECDEVLKAGKGSIKVAPKMSFENNVINITALPKGKTIDTIYKLLNSEIISDKIDVRDESTKDMLIVIEKVKNKSCNMQDIYEKLYSKLQTNISYNIAFFDENYIYCPCGFDFAVSNNLRYVFNTHKNRIEHQITDNKRKLKVLNIIEDLKQDTKNLQKLFTKSFIEACEYIMNHYKVDNDIAKAVLQKPISYLTKEHKDEIDKLISLINSLENDNKDIYQVLENKYQELQKAIKEYFKTN